MLPAFISSEFTKEEEVFLPSSWNDEDLCSEEVSVRCSHGYVPFLNIYLFTLPFFLHCISPENLEDLWGQIIARHSEISSSSCEKTSKNFSISMPQAVSET